MGGFRYANIIATMTGAITQATDDTITMKTALFAYGTLQIPEVMLAVAGRTYSSIPARLEGYACYALTGKSFPGLKKEKDKVTNGKLYLEIDPPALAKLDLFEDDFYQRSTLEVVAETAERFDAETYLISEQHYSLVHEVPWDLERFVALHLDSFLKDRHIFQPLGLEK